MKSFKFATVIISILSFLLPIMLPAAEQTRPELFHQGNEAYSRGDYEQAIAQYEKITRENGFSAQVLYNLAGSYGQAGKTGKAVLNYERALRLAPSDSDTMGNLELIRKENGLFQSDLTGIEKSFGHVSLNQWASGILISLFFFTLFTVTKRRFACTRTVTITISVSCIVLLVICLYGTFLRYGEFNPSVVVEADARLLVSPFGSSASIGTIQEGRLVYPLKEHNNYSYVKDETGRTGWIMKTLIEPVCKQPDMG